MSQEEIEEGQEEGGFTQEEVFPEWFCDECAQLFNDLIYSFMKLHTCEGVDDARLMSARKMATIYTMRKLQKLLNNCESGLSNRFVAMMMESDSQPSNLQAIKEFEECLKSVGELSPLASVGESMDESRNTFKSAVKSKGAKNAQWN